MLKFKQFILACCFIIACQGNLLSGIETKDIDHFWRAYDLLHSCKTKSDSIKIIQKEYLDKGTKGLKKFTRMMNLTAESYIHTTLQCPVFLQSIREKTLSIHQYENQLSVINKSYDNIIPKYKEPEVIFIIGCFSSGGTTSGNKVIIACEIAIPDSSTNTSELNFRLRQIFKRKNSLLDYVAHETIHTQQHGIPWKELSRLIRHRKLSLANIAILEGSADYFTKQFLDLNINLKLHQACQGKDSILIAEFIKDCNENPFDYHKWLHNNYSSQGIPDLGYYVGYLFTKSYYEKSVDKKSAVKNILHRGKYKQIIQATG